MAMVPIVVYPQLGMGGWRVTARGRIFGLARPTGQASSDVTRSCSRPEREATG
ncbi:hypothetical protein [Streptomyces sp. NPDC056982]|uniref:hypothetical protein n=1 Tax=Streptomyces sp. NPDC056982 TaxID=3345986 RepID=UPI0036426760